MASIQRIVKTGQQIDDLSNLIRDPSGAGPVAGAVAAAGRRFCEAFSNAEILRGDEPQATLPTTGIARAIAKLVCDPYLGDEGNDGPEIGPPPFEGGQCEEGYTVFFTVNQANGTTQNRTIVGFGPVTGVSVEAGPNFWVVRAIMNGVPTDEVAAGFEAPKPTISNVRVELQNGQPDDCGSLPGEFGPGNNPAPSPGPFPPGQQPGFDDQGQPFFFVPPISTPFGDFEIPEDFFGGEDSPAPPAGGDGLPGAPDSVADPVGSTGSDGAGEDFPFGQPPEGKIWVGVLIESTVDPRYGNIPGTGPQNTVYPNIIGNASLVYAGGYSSSSPMRSRWHEMFRAVTALEVTGARVQCRPGVSATVRPVSATICPENTCGV